MAIDFPSSPTNGQTYTDTTSGNVYKYFSTPGVWRVNSAASSSGMLGRFYSAPPALADFTWLNQGTASAQQVSGSGTPIQIEIPSSTLNWRLLTKSAPATPYSVIVHMRTQVGNGASSGCGLYFYASGSGKLMGIETLNGGSDSIRVEKLNGVASDNSTAASLSATSSTSHGLWLRLRNDGSTLYLEHSIDGYHFATLFSESVGTFLTPDAIGFGGANIYSGTLRVSVDSWNVTSNATA